VKILKGAEIPKASTEPRRQFYQHVNRSLWVADVVPTITGLIVLWDCSDAGTSLRLQLCCTKDSKVLDYWMIPIPHPANWMIVAKEIPSQSDDLDDLFDMDIEKKSEN